MRNALRAPLFDDRSRYLDRFGLLLAVTIAAVIVKSLVEIRAPSGELENNAGSLVLAAFVASAFLLALRAAGLSRRWQRLADVAVLISLASVLVLVIVDAVSDVDVTRYRRDIPPILRAVFGALTPIAVIWRVGSHRKVTARTLIGAISAYLLIALAFSDIFVAIDVVQSAPFFGEPDSSTRFMYFSIVTITTLGYGDLAPSTDLAGLAANAEAVIGQVFLVAFVGLLVGLRIAARLAEDLHTPDGPSASSPPLSRTTIRGRFGDCSTAEGATMSDVQLTDRTDDLAWYSLSVTETTERLGVDPTSGLDGGEVQRRLAEYGPNELASEPAPSVWSVAFVQLSNPMNIMLAVVAVASIIIGQISTGVIVGLLVLFNVVMGTNQELKAKASVDALSELQVPQARVRRSGGIEQIDSTGLVPGDIVQLEAGDLVPADGRIVTSATLEVQEAALTGESAPVAKDSTTIDADDVALGDRTDLVFQNTQVTRGTATIVVTQTGATTEMGRIADMVTAVQRSKSPLQQELDGLTKVFGAVAWGAVAIIAIFGIARGQDSETLILLCISTAIAAIPTGLPTFVQLMLSSGSSRLAEEQAVVKSLTDVETLGGTTVINSDKTGTLTMNAMTATSMLTGGEWFKIEGSGYRTTGAILRVAGGESPDFRRLALGLTLCSDATVAADETIIGDPTEAALVVLAAKIGVDAEETRRALPRRAEVPFDSAYKFMATFHDRPEWLAGEILDAPGFASIKGAPDVVLSRCDRALWHGELVPIEEVRDELIAANRRLSEGGLRVLSFAVRMLDDTEMAAALEDPMPLVSNLVMISLVGIIDPLRESAKEAVRVALHAGIDVRMITGDHTVTARAIADDLGLGPGVIKGVDFARMPDAEVVDKLPELHVFGRVAPEDKVRLAALMQEAGEVVAMTGDAVNDAAALKQADIGVAMGSGSEVSKQAAKMILTDDNFATLVRAVELGRDIYRRISSYVRLQLTVLSSVLQLMLWATIFNINEGVALFPLMLLFCKFFVVSTIVVGFITDIADPGVMDQPPRPPGTRMVNRGSVIRWLVNGLIVAGGALAVLSWGPDEPSTTEPSIAMTMAFGVVALSAVNLGLTMRRKHQPAWAGPLFPYLGWIMLGWFLTWTAIELPMFQRALETVPLTGAQWALIIGLSLIAPIVVEIDKAVSRHNRSQPTTA